MCEGATLVGINVAKVVNVTALFEQCLLSFFRMYDDLQSFLSRPVTLYSNIACIPHR